MIEARIAKVKVLNSTISSNLNIWVEEIFRVIRSRSFSQGPTVSIHWALPLGTAEASVFWICDPISVNWKFSDPAPLVYLSRPQRNSKNGEYCKEEHSQNQNSSKLCYRSQESRDQYLHGWHGGETSQRSHKPEGSHSTNRCHLRDSC